MPLTSFMFSDRDIVITADESWMVKLECHEPWSELDVGPDELWLQDKVMRINVIAARDRIFPPVRIPEAVI